MFWFFFLGIEVFYFPDSLHLSQAKYAKDLLVSNGLSDYKPATTPMVSGKSIGKFDGKPLVDPLEFWSIVGSL